MQFFENLGANKFNLPFILNIGAGFDYYAGNKARPLKFIRNFGLEWMFRVIQNPRLLNYRQFFHLNIYFIY